MITTDIAKRAERLSQLTQLLARKAAPEDRELLLQWFPVVFAETPDRIALDLKLEALAERVHGHFRFVAREMPLPTQLYRGMPGIHVSVRKLSQSENRAVSEGAGLPLDTTIVQTHTVDAPFIFDSLKHYFSKAGLRVFSAIRPICRPAAVGAPVCSISLRNLGSGRGCSMIYRKKIGLFGNRKTFIGCSAMPCLSCCWTLNAWCRRVI